MKNSIQSLQKQTGVALVVALVMMTLLTLLGVSNMSSSTINIKMAANSQQERKTFQAAFSGGNRVQNENVSVIDFTIDAYDQYRSYSYGTDAAGKTDVSITVIPGETTKGDSLSGSSGTGFLHLKIKSVAKSGGATSTQYFGIKKRVVTTE